MDGNSVLKYGVLAGGAWLAYQWWMKDTPTLSPGASSPLLASPAPAGGAAAAPAPSGGAAAPAPPASGSAASVPYNSLDAIFGRLAAEVGNQPLTADQFNYSLAHMLPAGMSAPDPLAVFNSSGTWDRTIPMTLANYWGAMAPYLKANFGLSGLGFWGGLGALARGSR